MTASMTEYETVFVLDPVVEENKEKEEVERVVKWITDLGGVDVEVERWGRRRLAYEINKRRDGVYNILRYKAPGAAIKDFERRMRLNENLLRVLTIVVDKKHRAAMEAAKAAEEAALAAETAGPPATPSDSGDAKPAAPAATEAPAAAAAPAATAEPAAAEATEEKPKEASAEAAAPGAESSS